MHIEKSYQQLTLVDDAGTRHCLCELLAKLCLEVKQNANAKNDRPKSNQAVAEETGAEDRQETDQEGGQGGGESPSGGAEKESPSRKNKATGKSVGSARMPSNRPYFAVLPMISGASAIEGMT